jgi:UPF0271 protein
MKTINLNSDVGEGFGVYDIGNDEQMLANVSSANIACGFHAGDPNVMNRVIKTAKKYNVSIGAHPGFNDIWGFGRRKIYMPMDEIEASVAYQIGALQAMASAENTKVTHVKPHGALNNMSSESRNIAEAITRGISGVDKQLILVAVAGSFLFDSGIRSGLKVASEAYADRSYEDDGNMTSRKFEHAMIRDAGKAIKQVRSIVLDGIIIANSGKRIPVSVDTICIHGDEPTGPAIAYGVKEMLEKEGITLAPLPKMQLKQGK